ncbi:MAG TPA: DUF192 domain-containing protein [Steroidobacteraceae bacterium]|nr:DUF192 domain-containing protein [Steroidobacteraceae bacterium]
MISRALATLRSSLGLLLLALLVAQPTCADPAESAQLDRFFPRSTMQIATPDARLHNFKIWIADNDQRRARGLMFVKHIGEDEGMLFIYPQAMRASMWMKNTFIPLDMLFVAADGKVMQVVANTEPQSLKTIESDSDVIAVIELKGGTASKLHIAKGARVMHAAFTGQPRK